MSSNQPRVWTQDDPEPRPPVGENWPVVVDKHGVRWVGDERYDGFEGWRSESHGFTVWRTWFNLAFERGPLTEVTPQASSAERSEEYGGRCAPTPSALSGTAAVERLAAALYAADCRAHSTDGGLSDEELWNTSSYVQGERDGHYRLMARAALDFLGGAQ